MNERNMVEQLRKLIAEMNRLMQQSKHPNHSKGFQYGVESVAWFVEAWAKDQIFWEQNRGAAPVETEVAA